MTEEERKKMMGGWTKEELEKMKMYGKGCVEEMERQNDKGKKEGCTTREGFLHKDHPLYKGWVISKPYSFLLGKEPVQIPDYKSQTYYVTYLF